MPKKNMVINQDNPDDRVQLYPVRVIPIDIGFKITDKHKKDAITVLKAYDNNVLQNVRLFGEDAFAKITVTSQLSFCLFSDGVGAFIYEDACIELNSVSDLSAESVLAERRKAHKDILSHTHTASEAIDKITSSLRSLVNETKRRFTANEKWESNGLSYVMSFYFLNAEKSVVDKPKVEEWLCNMLFTDRHTYFGEINDHFKQENRKQVLTNVDVLDDVHACLSWANFIVIGKLPKEHRDYYINLEIVLQHIWMYTYITEQNIDLFLAKSNKSVSSKQLTEFYDALIDMTLIVKKYDSIINSTVHERELRIFDALKESSKLEVLKKGIEDKSGILESKLSWALDQKRLKSDRNTELFIIVLTLLQVASGFGFGFSEISKPYVWPIIAIIMIVVVIYRLRD